MEHCVAVGDVEAPSSHVADDERAVVACGREARQQSGEAGQRGEVRDAGGELVLVLEVAGGGGRLGAKE